MKIIVLVKASLDVNLVRGDSEGNLYKEAIPLAISEYDRNAVYEAVKIKNEVGGKVLVVSALTWGPIQKRMHDFENVIREALALGGDEAHVLIDEKLVEAGPRATSLALSKLIEKLGGADLIICGEASMDTMASQVANYLAHNLGIRSVTYVRELTVEGNSVKCKRDLENYIEVVKTDIPAVISVTGEINKPKLPTLLQIRRAFAKPLQKYSLSDVGVDTVPSFPVDRYELVKISRKNVIIEGASMEEIANKLVDKLIEEGVLER